jgi:hypothetical protein
MNKKCGDGKFCDDFAKMLRPYKTGARGFLISRYLPIEAMDKKQIEPNDYRISGVGYKENHQDNGVMLNFCPFCGEAIDWFRKKQ